MTRSLTPKNQTLDRSRLTWQDGLLILAVITVLLVIVRTASQLTGDYQPDVIISTDLDQLPSYAAQTLLRMGVAYFLSLIFSLVYAYSAYRFPLAAKVLIPLLDILQSIPVLSFLPGVVLALIALFPGQRIGIELAAILLIFTGMTWNLVFSFYQSLSSIPKELLEVAKVYHLNSWQRFWSVELPSGILGLVWNSVMSVAGGWFFLMAIESFTLGDRSFRLPGLGSFLAQASDQGDFIAIAWGVAVLIGIIILLDFLVWKPLIAWAEKFKLETVESQNIPQSIVLDFLRRSPTWRIVTERFGQLWSDKISQRIVKANPTSTPVLPSKSDQNWWSRIFLTGFGFMVLWGTWEGVILLQKLDFQDWKQVITGAILTALRVIIALFLSLLWTVPVGVAIGRNPRLAQTLQPLVQIAASVPATALFPVLLLFLARLGGGLQIGSVALMMLGTMWYILFNVIAGAQAIPSELFEAASIYKLSLVLRWQTVILPGIFPYLITGMITAVGGAWNASIVSEYVQFQNQTLITPGLGSLISQATETGNYPLLFASTAVMSLLVVLTNRLIWRKLYQFARSKYQLL
ncbi:ABC transporter permease [Planktothrix agardhii]|jgi:NitT/TauT family transport system permease protein|uniref:Taurine transport system permease protein TauC n=1 Tax=Planktothrix agardhii TaxID=1160 RepID=A0AAD1V430_PLAAG|nr:ABC transporter permease subunit [Planktothrix agardhii]BBD53422.1 binding-protein-dependent transport systems inner membrane component [Planktothrix agardhii NIES-204]MCB8758604.1 ABC transporter permease subunit [Planktothrix agardhii 1813]MCB8765657.1 ABC transporter permease subunit [Planktothrix agardhii 1809]MCB8779289.1 ABC transporter permease subunit [Planktothrix agardhii 1031]MCB8783709.1 ABC transporter permease subunit [Planktothrix agardhii 1808]